MITDYCTVRKKVPGFPGPIAKKWCFPGLFQDLSNSSTFPGFPGPLATLKYPQNAVKMPLAKISTRKILYQ